MRPADHPEFYRLAAPPGQSRESTIVLDPEGTWLHDGVRVEHPRLTAALASWIARHPDDGRFILTNGYDWCYFTVQATPYFVTSVIVGDAVTLRLFDGSEEPLDPTTLGVDQDGVLYCAVKGGGFAGRFGRHAQLAMAPLFGEGEPLHVVVGDERFPLLVGQPVQSSSGP